MCESGIVGVHQENDTRNFTLKRFQLKGGGNLNVPGTRAGAFSLHQNNLADLLERRQTAWSCQVRNACR